MKKLAISGKGVIVKCISDEDDTIVYAGLLRSCGDSMLLDGKDFPIPSAQNYVRDGYLASELAEISYDPALWITDDWWVELPTAEYELPDDFDPGKLKLIGTYEDFEEWQLEGIWLDRILYDGEELKPANLTALQEEYKQVFDSTVTRETSFYNP